jgi:hypothetical protein
MRIPSSAPPAAVLLQSPTMEFRDRIRVQVVAFRSHRVGTRYGHSIMQVVHSAHQFSKWQIGPNGLAFIASGGAPNCFGCFGTAIRCQNNVCFTGSGIILDPNPLARPPALSSRLLDDRGWVAPDLDHDRVYFADAQYVMTFQFSTRTLLGTYLVPQAATDVNSFFLWHDTRDRTILGVGYCPCGSDRAAVRGDPRGQIRPRTVDIPKTPIKNAIKAGESIPGVHVEQRESLQRK